MINRFRGKYHFLCNFENYPVTYEGLTYLNSEAAFQAAKSLDEATRRKFTKLPPNEAKALGRRIKLRPDWEEVKDGVMREVISAKFSDPNLRNQLKSTGDKILIEGNTWHDNYWGDCNCPKCSNIDGKNVLGKLLMEIRKEI